MSLRFCPEDILAGGAAHAAIEAGRALPLAGGPLAFAAVEALARAPGGGSKSRHLSLAELRAEAARAGDDDAVATALAKITAPRPRWAGFALDRPLVMGILNITPDSFSDGGAFFDPSRAREHGEAMLAEGADIIDIGGESTRPGADPVPVEEERRRVIPLVGALVRAGATVSIDTRRPAVMRAALNAGARIINDITALTGDGDSLAVAAASDAAIVLMHMAGEPRTMQEAPRYDDVTLDVLDFLEARVAACLAGGIAPARLAVDPGIGFGKHPIDHNLPLLRRVALLHATGLPVVVGLSRKSFIGRLSRGEPAQDRLAGSLAGALWAADHGVQILRVHDVAATRQALRVQRSIAGMPA